MDTKVCVIFRGSIRPSADAVHEKIQGFMSHLSDFGVNAVGFLATWEPSLKEAMWPLYQSKDIGGFLIMKDFSENEIKDKIYLNNFKDGRAPFNAFRQYFMSRQAINTFASDHRFSHVIHTRTDINFRLGGFVEDWFNNRYCTIHTRDSHEGAFINDQFGIAPSSIMQAAWDYGTLDRLAAYFDKSEKPEDILQFILDEAGIKAYAAPVREWSLDPLRTG